MKNKTTIKQDLDNATNRLVKLSLLDHILIPSPGNSSPELGQAITRIVIAFFTLIVIQSVDYFSSFNDPKQIIAINLIIAYLAFSLAYGFFIYRHPNKIPLRKHAIIFLDILLLSACFSLFGIAGAAIYPLYIWVVIGNGLRFGVHFLHFSNALALSGFSIAVIMSPSWMEHVELAIGLGIAIMIMPLFFLALLKQIVKTNELLKNKIKETEYMVVHDYLTGLPNRLFLERKLKQAIYDTKTNQHQLTVFFVDVNSFKFINDTFGHLAGDELIIQFSQRLGRCLRSSDVLARLSGDEFMMLLDSKHSLDYAVKLAKRLMEHANGLYEINGHDIFISFSIGIAHYPTDGDSVESLIKNADTALHYAKRRNQSSYRFYDPQMSQEMSDELTTQNELRKALEHNEFELYYQAQVNSSTQNITGAEALLRWNHPRKGLINPDSFIDIAERNTVMFALGKWIIERACADRARWNALGMEDVMLTINISGRQFIEEGFVEHFSNTLDKHSIEPHQIGLEITERILVQEDQVVHDIFQQLKRMRIKLCLDDFGTGYSSLSYLKQFPINTIKIDRSFINNVPYDEDACSLVKAILAIGRSLKMEIIAEGVETQAQFETLRDWGCECIQGFYFSKPMPESTFLSHLVSSKKAPTIIHLPVKRIPKK